MCEQGDPERIERISATLPRFGTTGFLATIATLAPDALRRAVAAVAAAAGHESGARILGIHLEGPFLSHARRGVQPAEWITPPSLPLFEKFMRAAGGCARILTLAPEIPGALDLISEARKRGLVVAMGHTDSTYDQAFAAIERGAHHAVHVFNAMRPFSHRETGVLGAILTSTDVTAELIADGVHVNAAAMRLLFAAKGMDRVLLVSDATAAAGMPDGTYRLGTFEVVVTGGVCRTAEGRLAGSTLTLDRALRNVVALDVPLADAVRMLTLNPARLLGLERKKGVLAPGADADLVLLDEKLQVTRVVCRGSMLA